MRFRDYLTTLPAAEQTALPDALTLGYGRLQFAALRHQDNPSTAAMLGTLATAHAALRAALAILDRHAPHPTLDAAPAPSEPTDALPPRWEVLVGDGALAAVGELLDMAAVRARDAVRAIQADAEVATVRTLVHDALLLLADVRDASLGVG